MGARIKWDALLTAALVVCAMTTTGVVLYDRLMMPRTVPGELREAKAVFIEDWKSQMGRGIQFGSPDAPIQLLEFADFECPFCATFHQTLEAVRERYPSKILLSYVHYPLSNHRFAHSAARVAECAGEQGRFEAMHDLLFDQQALLGSKPWRAFAAEANVPDLLAFDRCAESQEPVARVLDGQKLGDEFGVQGTPTLVVNGWKLPSPPSANELERMVEAILAGQSPIEEAQLR